jgi:alcohol dehydrogenase (cytochrome c)
MYYLTETDPRGAMGLGGKDEQQVASMGAYLTAIDYKTGKIAWRHRYPGVSGGFGGGNGILTTAGGLVFAGDLSGNLIGYDAKTGKPLWHARLGNVSNAPQTYTLDGKQYILVAAGDALYSFYLQ